MNTYKDNPARGLSRFQKDILLRIDEIIEWRLEHHGNHVDYVVWANFPRQEMDIKYWGMKNIPMDTSWRVKYHRVKKSLLARGLIQYARSTRLIKLTEIGKEAVEKLKSDNDCR